MSEHKIWYQHAVFLWRTAIMTPPCGKIFLAYCEKCPNVDTISSRVKIEANNSTNRISQNNSSRKLIQLFFLLIVWPSYIDEFHNLVRVCVWVLNATGRIFHPQMLPCFRTSSWVSTQSWGAAMTQDKEDTVIRKTYILKLILICCILAYNKTPLKNKTLNRS